MTKISLSAAVALAAAVVAPIPESAAMAASAGPPPGRYACYGFGFNAQTFFTGVTIVILDGGKYTTKGGHFTGAYTFTSGGGRIEFTSGKLEGLKSWYTSSNSGKAIHVAFKNGKATNTAVCGILHK